MHSRVTVVKVSLGSVRQGFLPAAKKHDLSVVSGGGREKRFRRQNLFDSMGLFIHAGSQGWVRAPRGRKIRHLCDFGTVSFLGTADD